MPSPGAPASTKVVVLKLEGSALRQPVSAERGLPTAALLRDANNRWRIQTGANTRILSPQRPRYFLGRFRGGGPFKIRRGNGETQVV